MIDLRVLREDPDRARASQRARGEDPVLVDQVLAADELRRSSATRFDELRSEQKGLGKQVAKASGAEKDQLLARTRELAAEVKAADAAQDDAAQRAQFLLLQLSNLVEPGVPEGGEDDYVVLEEHGRPRDFAAEGFEPRDHVELGKVLGAIDLERGAKVGGARQYYLTGVGALLELALVNLAIAQAVRYGFTPMITPSLVKPEAMQGTGFLAQAAENVYHLAEDELYLVGTSEVPLAAYHMDEILPARQAAAALRRLLLLLPARGRLVRQGHPRHHPGAPVREGRDVLLLRARGRRRRAPAAARLGEGVPRPRSNCPSG